VTDEDARNITNGIIPDFVIQTGHLSPDEHLLARCGHLADTKTLNASKNHYGGEVLGLVVGDSGGASSDVHRVADLVAT
jgi:hypothetical protein